MKEINKIKENKLLTIKEIANNYNVTNYEISKNTGVSEGTLSRLMRGMVTTPRKNVIDAIYNYLTPHYPHNEATYNTQDKFAMERQEKLKKVKDLIKKYNVTAYEISKNTHLTAVGVQKIINGQSEKPLSVTLDTIYNYLTTHYPHNETTHNINSNGNNNAPPQQDSQVQTQENNIYSEMIATQRELIDTLKEQNSQYRKEIEYLRQKIKGYVEKSKK